MTDRRDGPPSVPERVRMSSMEAIDERNMERDFERLEREAPHVPLLLDYLHGELPPAGMRAVRQGLDDDESLKREVEPLAQMVAAVREREARMRRGAAPRLERVTESLMRRMAEEHGRRETARQAVGSRNRRRMGRVALLLASPLLLWLAAVVTPGVRDWWPLQPRWEVQRDASAERFDLHVDERTQLLGRGPLFLAVRRPGLGWPDRAASRTTEVVVDAAELTINYNGTAGQGLRLETPLAFFSTVDALVEVRSRPEGGQLIQVLRGNVMVTLRRGGGRMLPIGPQAELALRADGTIDDSPPRPGSPFARIIPEVP